MSVEMSSVQ